MSYFEAKMHQIRFRLGLRPRPRWGSSQDSPDPLAGFNGSYTSKGRGGSGREKGRGEKVEGKIKNPLNYKFLATPLCVEGCKDASMCRVMRFG